ncbi:MAG: S1 RNA-binding domain-containing protein [Syntrophomonadaceae bacterium]|nr:S1 RNA-binding domain-containing protein [Syntrophomonadaceae bacterium]
MNSLPISTLSTELDSGGQWNQELIEDLTERQKVLEPVKSGKKVFGGWDVLDPILKERIVANSSLPRKERNPIVNVLREFAQEYHKSFRSVQARYYQVIRKELEVAKEKEEAGEINPSLETQPTETVRMLPCNYPKVGDIVNTRVVNLIDYGIFLETDTGYTGFLRMGDVTSEEWLSGKSDLERYFYQGEKLKAKVIKVMEDKIYFSTKAIGGKKPHQLEPLESNGLKLAKGSPVEGELNELVKLLTGKVGTVTEPCKRVLGELLLTYGPVRVTSKLIEAFSDFDQGYWLIKQVKEQLDGEYNRLN